MKNQKLWKITLGEKKTDRFTKWHHLHVEAKDLEDAMRKAERLFTVASHNPAARPIPFLAIQFGSEGQIERVWKHSFQSREFEEMDLDEYFAEQVRFKERMAERRKNLNDMNAKADESMQRLLAQFSDLADAVRDYVFSKSDESFKTMSDAINNVTYV